MGLLSSNSSHDGEMIIGNHWENDFLMENHGKSVRSWSIEVLDNHENYGSWAIFELDWIMKKLDFFCDNKWDLMRHSGMGFNLSH